MTPDPAPDWFSDDARAVWNALPDTTSLAYAHYDDALTEENQRDLLAGDLEQLDEIDMATRDDAADHVLRDTCHAVPRPVTLTPDETQELLHAIHTRDESPWLIEQLARNTGTVTIALPLPENLDADQLAAYLDLPPDRPLADPVILTATGTDTTLDGREIVDVICHLHAADLVRLALAPDDHLATMTAALIGNDDPYCYETPLPLTAGATILVRVDELRTGAWIASPGRGDRRTQRRYDTPPPGTVRTADIAAPPPDPAGDTYLQLRREGLNTRAALKAGLALCPPDPAPAPQPGQAPQPAQAPQSPTSGHPPDNQPAGQQQAGDRRTIAVTAPGLVPARTPHTSGRTSIDGP